MTLADAKIVLGLSSSFTELELKNQYRKKVLISHPDRHQRDSKNFLLVQQAYSLLKNHLQNPNQPTQKTYQKRREAEYAYKSKVHYYVKKKKTTKQIRNEQWKDFKSNFKYFSITLGILSTIIFLSVLSARLGFFFVFFLSLVVITTVYKVHELWKK